MRMIYFREFLLKESVFVLKNSSPFILKLNTVVLYIAAFAILGALIFFYVRNRLRIRQMKATGDPGAFGKMSRSVKLSLWHILCERYPGLSDMIKWLDTQLLQCRKAESLELLLEQEWCCEDCSSFAAAPVRCRPCRLTFKQEEETAKVFEQFAFRDNQYLKEEEAQLLGWMMMEEVRRLLPFRSYHMKTSRVTRHYRVDNGVPVAWKDSTVSMENYNISVFRH